VVLGRGGGYGLWREVGGRLVASVGGGVLFGLSPYMLGHMLSQHLDLTFVFPVPLLTLLIVRYVRGRTSGRRFVAGFAVLLLVELGSSFELFVDLTLVPAVGLALPLLGKSWRRGRVVWQRAGARGVAGRRACRARVRRVSSVPRADRCRRSLSPARAASVRTDQLLDRPLERRVTDPDAPRGQARCGPRRHPALRRQCG